MEAPAEITETGEASFDGATLVVTSRRSFSSPAGDTVVEFKEIWSLSRQRPHGQEDHDAGGRIPDRHRRVRQNVAVAARLSLGLRGGLDSVRLFVDVPHVLEHDVALVAVMLPGRINEA